MTTRLSWPVALVAGIAIASIAPHATPRQVSAAAATTHVVVTEHGTTPVPDLAVGDLTVRSNGVAVPVVGLAPAPPLSIVLLLDVTSSMSEAMASFVWDGQGRLDDVNPSGYKPPDSPSALLLVPVLRGVLRNLTPGDRMRVGRIARTPELGADFASDRPSLERAVRRALDVPNDDRHAETPLWDAVDLAVAALEKETARRRAIVLITDGLSTGNRLSLDAVIERAAVADVAVFVIGEAWELRSGRGWVLRDSTRGPWFLMTGAFDKSPFTHLQRLARATGGVFVADGEKGWPAPEQRLRTVISLLRASYTLTFQSPLPPGDTGVLTVDVAGGPSREAHVKGRYQAALP